MSSEEKAGVEEREQTDESLRAERENADRVLAARHASAQEDADQIVQLARQNADAVLLVAREKADQELNEGALEPAELASVVEEREVEDAALRDERASADASLRQAREEGARALASLLPLEREKTDRYLLTERARSDDAVANRDDFLGIVSHDLRNLLGGIVMSAALLSAKTGEGAAGEQILLQTTRIQRYAARMNRLIGDLIDVASIDAGQLAISPTEGDTIALLTEAAEMFRAVAVSKGQSVQVDSPPGPLRALFDHDRMLQVLGNLITNASKFSAGGGHISICAERSGPEVLICVSDTGVGIPAHLLGAIFERFWQADKNDRRGVGLGLYISRCIVEAHGGRIWAESQRGEGSRLYLTLPCGGPDESQT